MTWWIALFFSSALASPQGGALPAEIARDVTLSHSAYTLTESTADVGAYVESVNPILMHWTGSQLATPRHFRGVEQAVILNRGNIVLIATKFNVVPMWISAWEEIGYSTHSIGSITRPLASPDTYVIGTSSYAVANYARAKTSFNRSLNYVLFKTGEYAAMRRLDYSFKPKNP